MLSYSIFAVAVVLGLVAYWLDERGADSTQVAALCSTFLGLSVLTRARSGIQAGRIRIRFSVADRTLRPASFWIVVGVFSAIGFILTIAGVLMYFGVL